MLVFCAKVLAGAFAKVKDLADQYYYETLTVLLTEGGDCLGEALGDQLEELLAQVIGFVKFERSPDEARDNLMVGVINLTAQLIKVVNPLEAERIITQTDLLTKVFEGFLFASYFD